MLDKKEAEMKEEEEKKKQAGGMLELGKLSLFLLLVGFAPKRKPAVTSLCKRPPQGPALPQGTQQLVHI
ncbi:LOW QUALITY PROTEIN: hypothetical protein IFM47457_08297 [Aspergillus lentulus]|nr:LOW QUALITY PROTEIN: hypothetical protein IFM47457_08297 [Aspergillus lentulus]